MISAPTPINYEFRFVFSHILYHPKERIHAMSKFVEKSKLRARKQKLLSIESDIKELDDAMKTAESCFNEVSDGNLLDALIYERAALEARYNYLIRELKALEATR